jgi:acetolactate synthase-1/2/3 large subunit
VNNAELIVAMLERAGVRWVFGVPSGPVLPLIEALRRSPVQFVLTASETSAGFMASTVGHLSGAPGVCASTVGPGATNLTTGVGAAWLDRSPVLAFTCNVKTPWLERRIQMRIDHHTLFRPLTKNSLSLRDGKVAGTLARALGEACAEPPGPVHLDLPEDVAAGPAAGGPAPTPPASPLRDIAAMSVSAVADALAASRRPLVLTGLTFARGGAAGHLRRFIEQQGIPFVSTLHGKGALPEGHPNWCGVIERARRTDMRAFLRRSDLIIAVGYDPIETNYEEWIGTTAVVHVSTEPADVGPQVKVLLNAGGDMDAALRCLAELPPVPNDWETAEFWDHRAALDRALRPAGDLMATHHVLDVLRARLPADGILAYDVGAHTHQIATQWRTDYPWTCLATNGWSSMGYGMPAAYAAKLVHPDREVVGMIGDGCFQMTVGELALARRLNLAVPIIVLNDGWLGLMKVKQERNRYPLSGVELGAPPPSPPHYFGVPCRSARDPGELRDALEWGFNLGGPSVIEAFVDPEPYSLTVYD